VPRIRLACLVPLVLVICACSGGADRVVRSDIDPLPAKTVSLAAGPVTDFTAELDGSQVHMTWSDPSRADNNRDGSINGLDLFPLAANFQEHSDWNGNTADDPMNNCIDVNHDGVLSGLDLFPIATDFGHVISAFQPYVGNNPGGPFAFVGLEIPRGTPVGNECKPTYDVSGNASMGVNYYTVISYDKVNGLESEVAEPIELNLLPGLIVDITADVTEGLSGLEVQFGTTITNGVGPYTYDWDFDDGNDSTEAEPSNTFSTAAEFLVHLTLTDESDNDTAQDIIAIQTYDPLAIELQADTLSGDPPLTVNFSVQHTGGKQPLTYAWDFGGEGVSSDAEPQFTFNNLGFYNVTVDVSDQFSGDNAEQEIVVGTVVDWLELVDPAPGHSGGDTVTLNLNALGFSNVKGASILVTFDENVLTYQGFTDLGFITDAFSQAFAEDDSVEIVLAQTVSPVPVNGDGSLLTLDFQIEAGFAGSTMLAIELEPPAGSTLLKGDDSVVAPGFAAGLELVVE